MAAGKRAPQGDAGAASDSESAGRSGSGPRAARGAARTWPRAGTSGSAALLLPEGHGAPQPVRVARGTGLSPPSLGLHSCDTRLLEADGAGASEQRLGAASACGRLPEGRQRDANGEDP